MAIDVKHESDPTVTTLVSGIISDAQDLLKQQFELLKHEVHEDLAKTRDAAMVLGLGSIIGLVGGVLLALMLVHLLNWAVPTLPLWACYGICGAVIFAIGGGLVWAGLAKFNSFNPLPDETAQTLKENVQWIANPK